MPERTPAKSDRQIDEDSVRVTRWTFPPGTETGWHVHKYDYLVVPIVGGKMTMENPGDEVTHVTIEPGTTYSRSAGVEHNVGNDTDSEFSFIEIELMEHGG